MLYGFLRTRDTPSSAPVSKGGHVFKRIGLEEYVWNPHGKGSSDSKAGRGRHPPTDVGTGRPRVDGLLCQGKLWLEERIPEQLKGEGG